MKEPLDIERLLHVAAPPTPDISETAVDQLYAEIARSTAPVKQTTALAVGICFLLAFAGSMLLMVVLAVPWWGITISFGSTIGITLALWHLVRAIV